MKWSSSKRDNDQDFSDTRVIQDMSWMAVSYVCMCDGMSGRHHGSIRNPEWPFFIFASPWYFVLSSVNDPGPWGRIECQSISETGNYRPGRVLEWVHFNRNKSGLRKNLLFIDAPLSSERVDLLRQLKWRNRLSSRLGKVLPFPPWDYLGIRHCKVSPLQKRRGCSTCHILLCDQCLLTMSAGFSSLGKRKNS